MANIETWYEQDLMKTVPVKDLGNIYYQDSVANLIGVKVTKNGTDFSLSGNVNGYCIIADGSTIPVIGTRSGNKASIVLPANAYSINGPIAITIKLTDGSAVTTLCACVGTVTRSRTDVQIDPGQTITDWTNTISEALQEVEDVSAEQDAKIAQIISAMASKINEPSTDGTAGQVLTTDGSGGRVWTTVQGGGGGGGGTTDYTYLTNKPQINGITLSGNKSLSSLGIAAASDIPDVSHYYTRPNGGIPSSDMSSAVRTSLGKADTAYQKPDSGIPASDIASGVIPDVSSLYTKPNDGIPSSDMTSAVQVSLGKADTAYQKPISGIPASDIASGVIPDVSGLYEKPSGGIPASDMASAVQVSLGKADAAYQKPSGGIPASDIASGVIPDVSGFYTKPSEGIPATDIAPGVIPDVSEFYTKPSAGIPSTDLAESYIVEPDFEGTAGQVLTTDGIGGRVWTTVQGGGGGGGTSDYTALSNKPQINSVTLSGNKSLSDLGIAAASDIPQLTDLIDDNAGDGDTTVVWSADKSAGLRSELSRELVSDTDFDNYTVFQGKPNAYFYGPNISIMENRPNTESNTFPFTLDVTNDGGYIHKMLSVYSGNGLPKLYVRQQYYVDASTRPFGGWEQIMLNRALSESPALGGTPTAPTAEKTTNNTQIATTAYVKNVVADYATKASPALTGTPTAPTADKSTNSTQIATTAYVKSVAGDYLTTASASIVANGNTHAAIASGQAVYVKNHSSLADGLYWASTAIGTNATLSTSNLTADSSGGLNKLNSDIVALNSKLTIGGLTNIQIISNNNTGDTCFFSFTRPDGIVYKISFGIGGKLLYQKNENGVWTTVWEK